MLDWGNVKFLINMATLVWKDIWILMYRGLYSFKQSMWGSYVNLNNISFSNFFKFIIESFFFLDRYKFLNRPTLQLPSKKLKRKTRSILIAGFDFRTQNQPNHFGRGFSLLTLGYLGQVCGRSHWLTNAWDRLKHKAYIPR